MLPELSSLYGVVEQCIVAKKDPNSNLELNVDTLKGIYESYEKINRLKNKRNYALEEEMNYNLSMDEICGILDLKERTAFRRIEHAFSNLADALNNSKHSSRL